MLQKLICSKTKYKEIEKRMSWGVNVREGFQEEDYVTL